MDKGNYTIALEETLKSVRTLDTINKPIRQADAYRQLGEIEFELGNYKNALKHKKVALGIYKKYKDKVYESYSLNDIAKIHLQLGKPNLAIDKLNISLKLSNELNIKDSKATALLNMGEIYLAKDEFDRAKKVFEESLSISKEIENRIEISKILTKLARTNSLLNDSKTALLQLNEAIRIADSIDSKKELRNALYERSRLLKNLSNYRTALKDYELFKSVNDTIFNTAKSQQIEELRTIYETEKKEQQLALQENEITVLEQEAKINKQQRWLLGGGMTLSFLALGFGFYGFRQKTKRSMLAKEKVDAELAFKKKELTTHALHLAKKNEVLENVKLKAKDLKSQGDVKGYQELITTINFDQQDDKNWESFTQYFEQVHKDFAKNVKNKYPEVSKNELRFMALLKMNMSSKEIATILNISPDGIKKARQRLRKKMALTPEESLENIVLAI